LAQSKREAKRYQAMVDDFIAKGLYRLPKHRFALQSLVKQFGELNVKGNDSMIDDDGNVSKKRLFLLLNRLMCVLFFV
jgi:hypothetical protein